MSKIYRIPMLLCLVIAFFGPAGIQTTAGLPLKEPATFDPNNVMSDSIMDDAHSMSAEDIRVVLETAGSEGGPSLLLQWPIGGRTAPIAILDTAVEAGVNPKVFIALLELELRAVTGQEPANLVQVAGWLTETGDYFNQAINRGGLASIWASRGAPMVLPDGELVHPANISTASLYAHLQSVSSVQAFTRIWTEQLSLGDLIEPEPQPDQSSSPHMAASIFSHPLGLPGGNGNMITQEFNVWYTYYNKWHAGEDWTPTDWLGGGDPVYAIADGVVLHRKDSGYPGGNLLLRHDLPDGSHVYSHYGHVNPLVNALDWVSRGQQIATIYYWPTRGENSHLHFEIRTVEYVQGSAYGPGYWSTDPREQGYLDPTGFIARHSSVLPATVQVLNTSSLNVRSSASLGAPIVATLSAGDQRSAIARQIDTRAPNDTDGTVWYQLQYDLHDPSKTGWSAGVHFTTMPNGLLGSYVYLTNPIGPGPTAPPENDCLKPLLRYWNNTTRRHFYTSLWDEMGGGSGEWIYEQYEGYVAVDSNCYAAGAVPFYRLWHWDRRKHFYTASESERDYAIQQYGFVLEGVSGYLLPQPNDEIHTIPLYRCYSASQDDHFYTTDWSGVEAAQGYGYLYESIAGYIFSPEALIPRVPVDASFVGSPVKGMAPLIVSFINQSTGEYSTCTWTFGDGGTSSSCGNPTHTYTADGLYTVSLMVSGPGGTDTATRTAYIEVWEKHRVYLPLCLRGH